MPETFGTETKTLFLKAEQSKLSQEFEAGAAIKRGQAVKLDTDGTVLPIVTADVANAIIGHAVHDAAEGELLTVVLRGTTIIWARSHAALNAGMVKFISYDTSAKRNKYDDAADETEFHAWALDDATGANQDIRVLLPG